MTRQKVLLAYNTGSPPADSVLAARALNVIEAESRSRTQNETESAIGNPSSSSGPSPLQLKELNELPASSTRGWHFYGAFGTLCLVTFIIALDSTIICVALPTIAEDVGATAIEAFWCGTSFLLASTVVQPPVASLSHIFSRRSALLASLTVFVAGSIMAALARNIAVLLGGRTLQGLGSGGILALTYVIATDLVSLRERGKWFGLISLNWAIGSILGPLIGGALVEVSWPRLFWINLPFCGIAYLAIPITMRIKRREEPSVNAKLREFDWIGTIVSVSSLISFLIPLSWGGIMCDWSSPRTVIPLIFGIMGLISFGFHIKFCRKYSRCDPLLRPSLFTSLTALSAYFATVIHGITVWCLLYYVPLYHEVRGSSPITAGVAVMPFTGTVAPAAVIVGLLVAKTGTYRPFIWAWVLIYLTGGLGLGILYSAQASASNSDLPFAASFYAFCRSLGQGIGVAVGGVTFQNEFRKQVEKSPEFASKANEWAKDASALVQILKRSPSSMQLMKETIIDGYIKGLRTVWLVLAFLACIAFLVSLVCVKAKSLDRKFET
ncbi:multidrug transporter [Fusarium napiforme]|uniref:Multidrug transporter n=1 Tax=Fusarium napiforme TaxID=42672 RepID=A0A8H5JY98_9HYPO|nr:multidrug transporter [Fusarium napiforme]